MGSTHADTLETYGYLLGELSRRGVAMVEVQRWADFLDPVRRGLTQLDVPREIAPLFDGAVVLNAGYDVSQAARAVEEGGAGGGGHLWPPVAAHVGEP